MAAYCFRDDTAKSAYEGFFEGAILFGPWKHICRTWAPNSAIFSCGWPCTVSVGLQVVLFG